MSNSYDNKFSIAHWDANPDDDFFFNCLKNSSEQYKNEIYDIFFGATFLHRDVTYGDVMGVNASEGQYKNLLKIQEKYGIPISLTLNSMDRPIQMIRHDIIKEFVSYIKKYYDDGVRSCTISHTHLMKTGALQEAFPDMDWKNTVNHGIKSTQEMLDYAALGYTTIQLDRKFNRSYAALKRTKKEADRIGVKTCLLIKEYCMPECPFKQEHDCWSGGSSFREIGTDYWETIPFTCNTWRPRRIGGEQKEKDIEVINPRTGTDMMVHSKDDWDEFASIVDIFKLSGRLNNHNPTSTRQKLAYHFEMHKPEVTSADESTVTTNMMVVDSFKEVYENNLAPLMMWFSFPSIALDYPHLTDIDEIKKHIENHFWNKKEAKALLKVLKNCRNRCYACHKCDDLFGTGKLDSILAINL